jgi:hypothetical protein
MSKKMTGTEAGTNALALGGLAQLSRNKNINNAGGVLGIVGVILLIGELIKFTVGWLIIKPCILIFKVSWIGFKYIATISIAISLTLFQYLNKGVMKLINNYKTK